MHLGPGVMHAGSVAGAGGCLGPSSAWSLCKEHSSLGLWGAGNRGSAAILTACIPQAHSGCKGRMLRR